MVCRELGCEIFYDKDNHGTIQNTLPVSVQQLVNVWECN